MFLKFAMKYQTPSLSNSAEWLALAALGLLVGSNTAQAQWRTQSIDLVEGFNAIYLHVDASHDSILDMVGDKPITEIWLWNPPTSSTQFVTSIDSPTGSSSNWLQWKLEDSTVTVDDLKSLVAPAAYLVNASAATSWSIKGIPRLPDYNWNTDGQNFIGFPIPSSSAGINFDNFLSKNQDLQFAINEIYFYSGGALEDALDWNTPTAMDVVRGRAYWLDADGYYNDYFGPFELILEDKNGVLFGDELSQYRVRLRNVINEEVTVTMTMGDSEAAPDAEDVTPFVDSPIILLRGPHHTDDDSNQLLTYSYTDLNSSGSVELTTLAPAGQDGSEIEIVLGLNRSALSGSAGDLFAGILTFTDDLGYSEIEIPVTAYKSSNAGLWVGSASIDKVRNNIIFYERDDDGTIYNEDGTINPTGITEEGYNGTPRAYSQRLILHVDQDENARLMQRVYYGVSAADNESRILANSQSLLDPDQLAAARRVSAVHFPWTSENEGWVFEGSMSPVSVDLDGSSTGSSSDLQLQEVDTSELIWNTADATVVSIYDGELLIQLYDSNDSLELELPESEFKDYLTSSELTAFQQLITDGPDLDHPYTVVGPGYNGDTDFDNINFPRYAHVDGYYAYISNRESDTVQILDISDLESIQVAHTFVHDGTLQYNLDSPRFITVQDGKLYFSAVSSDTIYEWNISDPASPESPEFGFRLKDNVESSVISDIYRLAVDNGYLFTISLNEDSFVSVDINSIGSTDGISKSETTAGEAMGDFTWASTSPTSLAVANGVAYVTDSDSDQLYAINVSTPLQPEIIRIYTTADEGFENFDRVWGGSVATDSLLILPVSDSNIVKIFDTTDPVNLQLVSELVHDENGYTGLNAPHWAVVQGNTLAINGRNSKVITLVDISKPDDPFLLEEIDITAYGLSVVTTFSFDGDTLVIPCEETDQVAIIQWQDPRENVEILTEVETVVNLATGLGLDLVNSKSLSIQEVFTTIEPTADTTVVAKVDDTTWIQVYDSSASLLTHQIYTAEGNLQVEKGDLIVETFITDFENFDTLVVDGLTSQSEGTLSADQKLEILAGVEGLIGQSQLIVDVDVDYGDQATNPFLHTYHPDHDNRDAEFSTIPLDIGEESYDVKRTIALLFATQEDDFDSLTSGATQLTGSYAEEITLTGKAVYDTEGNVDHYEKKYYGAQGSFNMIRISLETVIEGVPAIVNE